MRTGAAEHHHKLSCLALLCLLFTAAVAAAGQGTPTIRVPVRLVSVPTLVVSKDGKFVTDLKETDFHLAEDGHPRPIKIDTDTLPLSIAVLVQSNHDVRSYLPFISKVGSILDSALGALTVETALITYNDETTLSKPFGEEDLQTALRRVAPSGSASRLVDAGLFALELLKHRPGNRSRILLFVGQSYDSGSRKKLDTLTEAARGEGVQIYALKLPLIGRAFVTDTFRLQGLGSQAYRGGYQASIELTKAIPVAKRVGENLSGIDPFSLLTSLTGGFAIQFRKQRDLEDAVLTMGDSLRSRYFLSFVPTSSGSGSHRITVQVTVPGARVYSRSEYRP